MMKSHTLPFTENQVIKLLEKIWFCVRWLGLLGSPAIMIYGFIIIGHPSAIIPIMFGGFFTLIFWGLQLGSWFDNEILKWKQEKKVGTTD